MRLASRRLVRLFAAPALVLALAIAGCGGGGGGNDLDDCGNGRLDGGEACDDGNLVDNDACLSTCEVAVCGDGFLQTGVETCEIGIVPSSPGGRATDWLSAPQISFTTSPNISTRP